MKTSSGQGGLALWDKESKRVRAMRARLAGSDRPDRSDRSELFDEPLVAALRALESAEVSANIMLCLAHQASYLLRRQLERLEKDFIDNGGFTERLYSYRKDFRGASKVKEPIMSNLSTNLLQSDLPEKPE